MMTTLAPKVKMKNMQRLFKNSKVFSKSDKEHKIKERHHEEEDLVTIMKKLNSNVSLLKLPTKYA